MPPLTDPARPTADRHPALLVAGLGLAPLAWGIHLSVGAALVPAACGRGSELWLHLTTLAALALAGAGLLLARRLAGTVSDDAGTSVLGVLATALSLLSIGLIVVEGLVIVPLEPCG